jgi:hypothetical protein
MKTSLVALLCLSSTSLMASEIACDYKSKIDTEFMGTISSSKNYNQKSYPYVKDTRICIVKMDVKIHNTWYPTEAEYVFGPDMTEVDACKRAEIRAKESILRKIVPEKLNRILNQNCVTKTESGDLKQSPIVGGKLPEVSGKGSWTESAWKSVYSSVTKGCFPSGGNKKITLANGTTKWFYKEVCRTK